MNNQSVLLLIAIGVLIAVLFVIPSSENFAGSTMPYVFVDTSQTLTAEHSLNCNLTPEAPGCQPLPPVNAVETSLETCTPKDGQWSTPGTGMQGRSTLASPCCQPPDYKLARSAVVGGKSMDYKTCDDILNMSDPIEKCVKECCRNADTEANNFDTSWYPMARCACSLWCYNQQVPHFRKYGTAVHYITGDLAEAKTSDSSDFIGGAGFDFSGD